MPSTDITTGGRTGAPLTTTGGGDVVQQTQVIAPRDRVRWGPIVAGMLTALGTFLLLSLLALAIGAQTVRVGSGNADEVGAGAGIVTGIIGLLSFLLGGFVAGRTSAVRGRDAGLLNGFLVWALGIGLILLLASMGVGQVFGAAGDLFGQYRALGSPDPDVNPADVQRSLRNAAIPAFLSMALPAAAAALGGFLGSRDRLPAEVDRY